MSNTVYKIALAGLLHDVGKFAERARMELEHGYESNNSGQYQPSWDNRPTHKHALYSAAFIERFAGLLPEMDDKKDARSGDSLINLAAMHHRPGTAMQWLVTQGDRLSSGMDRQIFEGDETGTAYKNFRKTRLIPIAEEMLRGDVTDTLDSYNYRFPLCELSTKSTFALKKVEVEPADDKAGAAEYGELFAKFCNGLEKLSHRDAPILWFDSFASLWERFTSLIPAATVGKIIPDVSLYDHSRATSALASALYLYHTATDSLNDTAVKNKDIQKFMLIKSDFFGIQKFIFSDGGSTNKGAAKLLRGRSFAVSLLSELAGQRLCEALQLPSISIVLNAAGKFTMIAPNLPETVTAVQQVEEELNRWLMDAYYGEVTIGFTTIKASPTDFEQKNFPDLWERLAKASDAKKYRKFNLSETGSVAAYLDSFDNNFGICTYCGKRPAKLLEKENPSCPICCDHIHLGEQLIKSETISILDSKAEIKGNRLKTPLFGRYQIAFDLDSQSVTALIKRSELLKISSFASSGKIPQQGYAVRCVSGYIPVYCKADQHDERLLHGRMSEEKKLELIEMINDGGAKSFQHIAKAALNPLNDTDDKFTGIEALGILKADVDNLGKLFAFGLPKEKLNLSRMATFSRQLDSFFSLYLPSLLASDSRFINIYTVFAGGDDLFLIGPWNRIIEFAGILNQEFSRFSCGNPKITISAGITVDKPGVPVPTIATRAEESLEASKHGGRNRLTLFDETVTWDEFETLQQIKETLANWQENGSVGKGLMYQLNGLIAMAKQEKQIRETKRPIDLRDMSCLSWRSKLTYSATRNVGKGLDKEKRQGALEEVVGKLPIWLHDYDGKMKIALWQILYNQR